MNIDERLDEISKKLDNLKEERKRDKYENLGFISLGFMLATIGLSVANHDVAMIVVTVIFLISGIMLLRISYSKKKQ